METLFTQLAASGAANHFGLSARVIAITLITLTVWSLIWKGVALWFAARNYQKGWFIALLILNTLGILEIIYLLFFRRDRKPGVTQSLFNNPTPNPETAAEVI